MSRIGPVNRTIWITTVVMGDTLAIAGFHHGLFAVLQGNQPTPVWASKESRRALALEPGNVALNFIHALVLEAAGRHDEAAARHARDSP